MTHAPFYMVLADNSSHTQYRHPTLDSARNDARLMALKHPCLKFYVLASLGHAVTPEPVTWELHKDNGRVEDDGIPF